MSRYLFYVLLGTLSGCLFFGSDTGSENNTPTNNTPENNTPKMDVSTSDMSSVTDTSTDVGEPVIVCPPDEFEVDGACEPPPIGCLDEKLDNSEECDESAPSVFQDGTSTSSCSEVGNFYSNGGELGCSGCRFDVSNCSFCGDGELDPEEACDGMNFEPGLASCVGQPEPFGLASCSDLCQIDYSTCRRGFEKVSVGTNHICALRNDGKLACWGGNPTAKPPLNGNSNFVDVAVGRGFSCGLKDDRTVTCWTMGGALIDGTLTDIKQISVGPSHACFLDTSNKVACKDFTSDAVPLLNGSSKIVSGPGFVCGITLGGNIQCVADEDRVPPAHPVGPNFDDLYAGLNYVCAKKNNNIICPTGVNGAPTEPVNYFDAGFTNKCWITTAGITECSGLGGSGPPAVELSSLSVGDKHACGIVKEGKFGGEIRCWGLPLVNGEPTFANSGL